MSDLIPQPHGGAISPRMGSRTGTSWTKPRADVVDALRQDAEIVVARFRQLIASTDDRVAMVAVDKWMAYVFGPVQPGGLSAGDGFGPIDLSALTGDERAELTLAYSTVQRLLAVASDRVQP